MNKIFRILGFVGLVCFSFFYTDKIATVIKNNDDIMIQIKEVKEQYKKEPIDAKIEGETIIPGISGQVVNIKKSYDAMEKIDSFNSEYLVYDQVKPEISVNKVYDKYIISGNKSKKEVNLVFLVNDEDDIKNIVKILGENKASFFIDGNWFEKYNEDILDLVKRGHTVGNLGYNSDYSANGVSWMNTIVTKIAKQKNTFCYNETDNEEALERCQMNNSYTIRPNILAKVNPFITIKSSLINGSIIALDINEYILKELPLILNYINSKDLKIVNLNKLIDE